MERVIDKQTFLGVFEFCLLKVQEKRGFSDEVAAKIRLENEAIIESHNIGEYAAIYLTILFEGAMMLYETKII